MIVIDTALKGRLIIVVPLLILGIYARRLEYHWRKYRDGILIDNIGLARAIAHDYVKKSPEPYEVLENLALTGLSRAIEQYDPSKQVRLSTFSRRYIQGEIQHYLRDHIKSVRIPRSWQEWYEAVIRYHRRLEDAYNRGDRSIPAPPIVQIDEMFRSPSARGLMVGPIKPPAGVSWAEIEEAMNRKVYSLDAMIQEADYA